MSQGKYIAGIGYIPKTFPNDVNGRIVPTAIPVDVINKTGMDALL